MRADANSRGNTLGGDLPVGCVRPVLEVGAVKVRAGNAHEAGRGLYPTATKEQDGGCEPDIEIARDLRVCGLATSQIQQRKRRRELGHWLSAGQQRDEVGLPY